MRAASDCTVSPGATVTTWITRGRIADASVAEIQSALQSMRVSTLSLRRQAYQALHDIVGAAYFSDPGTWSLLRYPGPVAV